MLDPSYIREHATDVKENVKRRQASVDVDVWLELDRRRAEALKHLESLRAQRNAIAAQTAAASVEDRPALIESGKRLKEELAMSEETYTTLDAAWKKMLLTFPNLTHPGTPSGFSDAENVELRRWSEPKRLSHPKSHVELATLHDLIDFDRGAKVTGAKFYFLKGKLAILEQALIRFALEELVREGFVPLSTPDLARDDMIIGGGYQPRGPETQIYSIEGTELSLIGTSEITLLGFHANETFPSPSLPLMYAGISHCYRTEAGTYGKESYGLYRVHQFSKVEMFVFCAPEQSEAIHGELLRHEENLFQALEIPYRVMEICTADLGGPAYRKYDLEAWMWGRGEGGDWGEVTSASNCTDFQARRLNIRIKTERGNVFAHTLNGTALATSRAMLALIENHQNDDGSISIPQALVPFCGFEKIG